MLIFNIIEVHIGININLLFMSMEDNSPYSDLSLSTSKCIDVTYFLDKIKTNGYSTVALDQEVADAKQIVNI